MREEEIPESEIWIQHPFLVHIPRTGHCWVLYLQLHFNILTVS